MGRVTPEAALAAAYAEMDGPFVWGVRDCTQATAAAFMRLWEINILPDCPSYTTARGALAIMRDFYRDRPDCPEMWAARAGLVGVGQEPGALCKMKMTHRNWALGLCIDAGLVAFKGPDGVTIKRTFEGKYWGPSCLQS